MATEPWDRLVCTATGTPTGVAVTPEPVVVIPVNLLQALLASLEAYGFTCEAGALINCLEWYRLRQWAELDPQAPGALPVNLVSLLRTWQND
jgi:hypothetical protein